MSVLIKGMEMPTSCAVCPFENYGDCYGGKVKAIMDIDDYVSAGKRHPRCPLVPVPTHGRLIDADELRWCYDNSDVADDVITKEDYDQLKVAVAVVRQTIDDAPTIIEAEEGE